MRKLFVILLLLFAEITAYCQEAATNFIQFANAQNDLMVSAYNKRDVATFNKHLNELLAAYNKLSDKDKADNKNYIDGAYYNLACTYALKGDKKRALDNLEKSAYYNYDHLVADSDMNSLRKEPRFIKFLAVAKSKKVDYVVTLQKAAKYNTNEKSNLPTFTYQSYEDPNLKLLRKMYGLDSIAGRGNDVSQIINLMRWVHNLIPHNGSKGNPDVKNAMSFITVCKRDNKTLNCRGLAIILNEVYLAEGFKSRLVTCLPKDTADQDCHVITIVYSDDLKKWIWMDPTFMAYIMNEKGELLDIAEVRERLIADKPLILNPDADHNHETTQTKKEYLEYYMAKNLYKLECPVSSEYNYETQEKGKVVAYIELVPGDKVPEPEITNDKHGIAKRTVYYTSNPKIFWQTPPGQTQADFENALSKFKQYYNLGQADSICNMFSDEWGAQKSSLWSAALIKSLVEKYGEMKSFKFMGIEPEDGVMLFKTEFTKSTHATGLTLDRFNKLGTFRFKTSSSYINNLLAKEP